jgi:hypothetical protein
LAARHDPASGKSRPGVLAPSPAEKLKKYLTKRLVSSLDSMKSISLNLKIKNH